MTHSYKLCGYNIVLDIASGSIHSVDEVAYDAINEYERLGRGETVSLIKSKYDYLTDADISELFCDIERPISRGKLFSVDSFENAAAPKWESHIKALCLNVSHLCNMTCSYCFAGKGEYNGSGGLMDFETGKRAIDFLIDNSGARMNLDVDFFGGEPLLNWEVVKDIVRYARKAEQGKNKRIRFTLTTNGILIDDDVISFTNREMHNIVLSLDGRPEINDAVRKLANGEGSYAVVMPKMKKLVEARHGKGYYIRGTFTRENTDFVQDILHLADLGFKELSMEPAVSKPGEPHALTMDDLPEIGRQYETLAIEMLRREKEGRGFTFYHYKLDLSGGPCVHKRIAGCGVGTEYMAVTPAGELFPCHQFVGNREFLMGDIWQGITNTDLRREFGACGVYSNEECRSCWARFYCSGGCKANAYNAAGNIGGVYKLGCEMFKKRVECAIMIKVAGV